MHPILYRVFQKFYTCFRWLWAISEPSTVLATHVHFWKFRLKLHFAASFFIEADFTPPKNVGWVLERNMLRSGYLHVDQLVVTEATEADATSPLGCLACKRLVSDDGLKACRGDNDWSWKAPVKMTSFGPEQKWCLEEVSYLPLGFLDPREFSGAKCFFLKLDVEGPFRVRGWNQDPPKLLSDSSCQTRYAVRFVFTNRFWSPFLGDDIFFGSILDILWYLYDIYCYWNCITILYQSWYHKSG